MKILSLAIVLVGLVGLLVYTNPGLDRYKEFLSQQVTDATRKEHDPVVSTIGSLFGGIATSMMAQQTIRQDYVLFSTYDTVFGEAHLKAVGVLSNFYITEQPDFKQDK